jgi:hypothetical protein
MLGTAITVSLADSVSGTVSGTEVTNASDSHQSLGLDAVYGVTDRLDLGVSFGYLLHNSLQVTVDSTSAVSTYNHAGISDPVFTLGYRLPYSDRLLGDFFFSVSPKIVKAKSASSSESGNNGKGDTAITIGTDLLTGNKHTEWRFGGDVELDSSGSTDAGAGSSPYTFDFSGSASFAAQVRFHTSEAFFIDTSAALQMQFSQEAHYSSGTYIAEVINADPSPILNLTLGLKIAEHGLLFWRTEFQSISTTHLLTARSDSSVTTVDETETALAMAVGLQFEL